MRLLYSQAYEWYGESVSGLGHVALPIPLESGVCNIS